MRYNDCYAVNYTDDLLKHYYILRKQWLFKQKIINGFNLKPLKLHWRGYEHEWYNDWLNQEWDELHPKLLTT